MIVSLIDGRQVDSASEDWRRETEARSIAALRTLADRRAWLEAIEHKRGKAEADRLRVTMQRCGKPRAHDQAEHCALH